MGVYTVALWKRILSVMDARLRRAPRPLAYSRVETLPIDDFTMAKFITIPGNLSFVIPDVKKDEIFWLMV